MEDSSYGFHSFLLEHSGSICQKRINVRTYPDSGGKLVEKKQFVFENFPLITQWIFYQVIIFRPKMSCKTII